MTMVMPDVRGHYFPAPPITDLPGELLDVATIVEGVTGLEPTGLMESYNCLNTGLVATFPCPVSTMAAPVQSASSTSTTGGTLAAGTYRAKITAINTRGETIASNEQSQVTTGATSTITWNWAAVTGATGYKVYVTAVGGGVNTETFLVQLGAVVTYVWTGTPAQVPGNAAPPTTNTAIIPVTKTFGGPSWQDGFRFAVYAGAVCKSFEPPEEARVREAFLANESFGIEQAVMVQRMRVNGSSWAAATDLTPAGGAVTPVQGLAILEGNASWSYAGVPTIHAPRSIGSVLGQNNQIIRKGEAFYTFQGSKLASGAGYEKNNTSPTGTTPTVGEYWMYASGEVVIARSELVVETQMNRDTNEIFTLVERLYVAAVDCYTAAVRVKLF